MSRFDVERFAGALTRALEPYSLREASEATGVSAATLSRLERGGVPELEIFFTLCAWMQASPAEFALGFDEEPRGELTAADVVRRLRAAVDSVGDQKTWAQAQDLSPSYVNDVLRGRREPGESILVALGLERVVIFRERTE
jgi:hypothetical protein